MSLNRKAFQEHKERRQAQREANLAALCQPSKTLHSGVYAGATSGKALVKENASQSPAYQNAVRDLGYCMLCRKSCRPQFCHADQGKGTGIKTDVRRGWPGCAECHYLVGTSGQYPKEQRRALEADLARRTRDAVRAAGLWPTRLPMWNE